MHWLSGEKIQVNAAGATDAIERVQIKAILKVELERF
jgi:hypothetical protein